MKILFTGGGSGGHVFPIIAVSREIKKICARKGIKKLHLVYVGPQDHWAKTLLSQEGIKVKTILAGKIRRYFTPKAIILNIIDIFIKIPLGALHSFFLLFFESPDLIFSKGGYGSVFVVFWGRVFRTPIFIHESDKSPGLANRMLSKLALELFVSFSETEYFPAKKMIVIGNPIRKEILEGSKEMAKNSFKLILDKPVILITGGSQGAQRINDVVLAIMPEILESFELIHLTGEKNFKQVKAEAEIMIPSNLKNYYHPFPFLREPDLRHIYQAADFIVSRAGSGNIFEIAALGKPSLLIPLPEAAQNHQVKNAYAYAKSGATVVMEEDNLTPNFFLEKLKYLFSRPEQLQKMSLSAQEWVRPHAARVLAGYIVEYLSS